MFLGLLFLLSQPALIACLPSCLPGNTVTNASPAWQRTIVQQQTNQAYSPFVPGNPAELVAQAVVLATTVADVQLAVKCLIASGTSWTVRSGGHAYDGSSINATVVLDVSGLNSVAISPDGSNVTAGAGVNLGTLLYKLNQQGLCVPVGSCPTVGLSGYAQGGGFGLLQRRYGLFIDSLLSVDIVNASGGLVTASASQNTDLFWAVRGGGAGNFGVAVAFTARTHPAPRSVILYNLEWDLPDVPGFVSFWQSWATGSPPGLLQPFASVRRPIAKSTGFFYGAPSEVDSMVITPHVNALGSPRVTGVQTVTWLDVSVPRLPPSLPPYDPTIHLRCALNVWCLRGLGWWLLARCPMLCGSPGPVPFAFLPATPPAPTSLPMIYCTTV